jgi:hypothetical protein
LTAEPLRLRELLKRLTEAEIRFVLVGGLAVNAWGYLRATRDLDVEMDGIVVRVCSLDHLFAMKRASERPRDRDDLESLEAVQRSEDQKG